MQILIPFNVEFHAVLNNLIEIVADVDGISDLD